MTGLCVLAVGTASVLIQISRIDSWGTLHSVKVSSHLITETVERSCEASRNTFAKAFEQGLVFVANGELWLRLMLRLDLGSWRLWRLGFSSATVIRI